MLRGGGNAPALNYFGLVRPQLDFAQQNQQLGQGLQTLQSQQMQSMQTSPGMGLYGYSQLGVTGHAVAFNSYRTSQFTGSYTGAFSRTGSFGGGGGFSGGGGFGGSGFGSVGSSAGGGINQGFSQFGSQAGTGFSQMTGQFPSFGNIVQPGVGAPRGR